MRIIYSSESDLNIERLRISIDTLDTLTSALGIRGQNTSEDYYLNSEHWDFHSETQNERTLSLANNVQAIAKVLTHKLRLINELMQDYKRIHQLDYLEDKLLMDLGWLRSGAVNSSHTG